MHRVTKQRARSGSFSSAEVDDDDNNNNNNNNNNNHVEPPASKSSHKGAATTAAAAAAAALADTTLMVSDDMINMVATFASCRDLCSLGQVCRRFSPLPFHEDLWELRALDILPGASQLQSAMSALSLATYRELLETFTRIGIPGGALGFWQAEPPSLASAAQMELLSGAPPRRRQQQQPEGGGGSGPSAEELEARGELLRIGLEAGGFVCETIVPNGVRRRIFTIRVSKTAAGGVKIGFFSQEREFPLTIGGGDDDWVPGDSMAEAKARYTFAVPGNTKRSPIRASGLKAFFLEREDGRICRYVKLTAPPPLPLSGRPTASAMDCSSSSGAPAAAAVATVGGVHQSLCGLWCAPYGSHGLEIVQLSTDSSSSPFDGEAAAAVAAALAEDAAAAVAKSPLGAGGAMARSSSWSRASISRMTDGSESVCTSAPATDDGNGSEAAFCGGDDGSGSESGDGDLDGADGTDGGDAESAAAAASDSVDCVRQTTKRKRKRHRANHHQQQQQQQQQQSPVAAVTGAGGNNAAAGAAAPAHLFGFKVTGDENVPAGKTSFVIDLSTGFDVDEELQSDSRPVVMFLPSGAVMANLANRREQISTWHKGRGQINRVPGRWLPEWVDVEFVAYRPGSRSAFSVIFRQPAQAVRVVMDFERAHGCEEGWPQWPAAAAAAAAAAATANAAAAAARAVSGASRFA